MSAMRTRSPMLAGCWNVEKRSVMRYAMTRAMLASTFIILDGIGEKTERRLWQTGILRWRGRSLEGRGEAADPPADPKSPSPIGPKQAGQEPRGAAFFKGEFGVGMDLATDRLEPRAEMRDLIRRAAFQPGEVERHGPRYHPVSQGVKRSGTGRSEG